MPSAEHDQLAGILRSLPPEHRGMTPERRAAFEAGLSAMPLADGVTVDTVADAPVPAERLRPAGGDGSITLLWFHGGAYVVGSPAAYRPFLSFVAADTGADVVAFDYRLAPEHPFPAAVDDGVAGIEWAARTSGDSCLVVGGDSAGAGLTAAALLRLRDAGSHLPAAVVLVSPWVDLRCDSDSYVRNAESDAVLLADNLREQRDAYLAGHDAADPLASPVLGDLTGLPPMLIVAGGGELFIDDATALRDRASTAGVDVELYVAEGCMHDFLVFSHLPESTAARARIATFLDHTTH